MTKIITYINFVLTILIIGFLVWFVAIYNKPNTTSNVTPKEITTATEYVDNCGQECKKIIKDIVSESLSTISGKVKEEVKIVTVTPRPTTSSVRTQTTYLPIVGPISTTSTTWYDAPGTDFYLNIGDYGKNSYATWEASLKVAHGNGGTYVRLYDVTNKIAVNGSEVFVSNSENLKEVFSGSLNFWSGNNQYRVQIKSLNGYEATFGGGRIKIMY